MIDTNRPGAALSPEANEAENIRRRTLEEQQAVEQKTGSTARGARLARKRREQGLHQSSFWYPKEDHERVKAFVKLLMDTKGGSRADVDQLLGG